MKKKQARWMLGAMVAMAVMRRSRISRLMAIITRMMIRRRNHKAVEMETRQSPSWSSQLFEKRKLKHHYTLMDIVVDTSRHPERPVS